MIHFMGLNEEPFESILTGEKRYEIRLYDPKRQKLRVGDQIEFTRLPDKSQVLTVDIVELNNYPSFEEMFNDIPLRDLGCSGSAVEDIKDSLCTIYSKEQEMKWGVLAVKLKLSKNLTSIQTIAYS